ncbi:hypothetical protein, partial [Seonamhaeicola maritimus]
MKKNYIFKFLCTLSLLLLCSPVLANNFYLDRNLTPANNNCTPYYGLISDYAKVFGNDTYSFKKLSSEKKISFFKNSGINSFSETVAFFLAGDYRSSGGGTGNWTDPNSWQADYGAGWVSATDYPGQNSGTNNVLLQSGHTITIDTNFTTQTMVNVVVNGTLDLNPPNPWQANLNTTDITIDGSGALLDFSGAQASLILPANAVVSFSNGGDIVGSCTPNNEIIIGGNQFAACKNPAVSSYTFGAVVATGGTLQAVISSPGNGGSYEACSLISFSGGFSGPGTSIDANWFYTDPNGDFFQIGTTDTLVDENDSTNGSFNPTIVGQYVLTLEVTDGSLTNAANIVFDVTADVTDPVISCPSNVSVNA